MVIFVTEKNAFIGTLSSSTSSFLNCARVSFQSRLHTMTKEGHYHLIFMSVKHGLFEAEHKYSHKQCL